jgi:hypothetical protein
MQVLIGAAGAGDTPTMKLVAPPPLNTPKDGGKPSDEPPEKMASPK